MEKDYEKLIISFIELSGSDILTSSKDNDGNDNPDWNFADDGWGK